MIDLTTKSLPDTITVNGRDYQLNTDYRYWIRFTRELAECMRTRSDFDVSYLFREDMPHYIDIALLIAWAHPSRELPRDMGEASDAIAYDFDIDADLIYSAFLQQYGIDLVDTDMHWYKFIALMQGISDDTRFGKIIGYRTYEKNDRKYEEQMKLLKRMWEIIPPLTMEEQADVDELNNLFD